MSATTHLVDHWTDTREWSPGRALFACYATFDRDPELQVLVRRYQDEIADLPGLDLIRPEWLHLTIQGIAFSDLLGPGEQQRIVTAVSRGLARVAPPVIALQPPEYGRDGIYLPAGPAEPLAAAREVIRAELAAIRDPGLQYALPGQDGPFDPHVSIAYANTRVPLDLVRARLDRVPAPGLNLTLSKISLIMLRRGDHRWSWTDAVEVTVGSGLVVSAR